jgi:peroxiredoxin
MKANPQLLEGVSVVSQSQAGRFLKSLALFLAIGFSLAAQAQETNLKWKPDAATKDLGYYVPQRLKLSAALPESVKKSPPEVTAPLYGEMKIGPADAPAKIIVLLDEPAGKPSRLFVDSNANGDLTDDPTPNWNERKTPGRNGTENTIRIGDFMVKIPYAAGPVTAQLAAYRFDKNDPTRAALMDSIFYYREYALKGDITLGGKSYTAMLADDQTTGDFRGKSDGQSAGVRLLVDANADGKYDSRREAYDVRKPFNIGGTTWEIADLTADGLFKIVKSSETVAEIKPAPNVSKGAKAPPFTAKTTDGKNLKFPDAYKGKVVMLDFWATWCGPCIAELPNVLKNYEKFHSKGFEILGISLDRDNYGEKLAAFTKEKKMTWPQIYDGKFWQAEIGQLYGVEGIPFMLIVDGDTGEILDSNVRGENLGPAIEQGLAKKRSTK